MSPGAPIVVREPTGPAAGIVIDSPHSGMDWPDDFQPAAPRHAILTTWDAFVDELWADAVQAGATLVAARFPRAYIDVNRAAGDIDPAILDGAWPGPVAPSDYSRRGMGLIRRDALPGVPMYDGPLTVVAVQARLDTCYHPYRQALASAVLDAHTRHGEVWHFNCHSMKSRGNAMNVDAGALRPDIVVSDRRGTTADPAVTAWVAAWFEARGFTTRINDPYQGGDLVRSLGKPSAGRHSVQVEINRAIYMCEDTFERGERFDTLRETLSAFVGDAVAHLRTRRERRASR